MAQTQLELATEGLGNSIAQSLEPVLTPIIQHMADWIAANRQWIATKIASYVQQFATWIASIDWDGIQKGAASLWGELRSGVDAIGGLKTTMELFLGLWTATKLAPIALAVARTGPIGLLVAAMASIAWATERTRDAWNDFRQRQAMANDDPASEKARARLPAFRPTASSSLTYTGKWLPSGMKAAGGTAASRAAAASLFAGVEQQDSLPAGILDRMWARESSRGAQMVSSAGALGHFGFMPGTAKQYGVDPTDLGSSATGAGAYMRDLLRRYGGDTRKALAAYNWGPGNVDKDVARYGAGWSGHLPNETRDYVADISGVPDYASGTWPRARYDLRRMGAAVGIGSLPAPLPATVPSGNSQGPSLDAAIAKLRADLHITVKAAQGTTTSVRQTGGGGMRVASVQTQRAMDPAMTPGGY